MEDNLDYFATKNIITIHTYKNNFNLKINLELFTIPEIYIILFSYLKNINIQISKILIVTHTPTKLLYKNITFIRYFSYIDFKLWLIKKIIYAEKTEDTQLYALKTGTPIFNIEIYYQPDSIITNTTQPKTINLNFFKKYMYIIDNEDFIFNYINM